MNHPSHLLPLTVAIFSLSAIAANAAVLAYEGFSSSASGAGDDYQIDGSLRAQSDARTGFTGLWSSPPIATGIGYELRDDNMSYTGTVGGTNGALEIFENRAGQTPTGRSINRSLSYTTPDSDDYYFVFGWATTDTTHPATTITLGGARIMTLAVATSGVVSVTFAGASAQTFTSGSKLAHTNGDWNFLAIKAMDDPGGADPAFYDTAEIWLNPTITGGSLGAADGTGRGIIRDHNGGGTAVSFTSVSFGATVGTGDAVRFDEFYIATDVSDFLIPEVSSVIPEPSAALLGGLGLLVLFRRRR